MRWELYPRVFEHERARTWLSMQHNLRLAPNTIEAYGRSLEDFLAFCEREGFEPESVGGEQIGLYVGDLASRSNPRGYPRSGAKVLNIGSGVGLSNATMQLRLTTVRLFYDHLIERGLRRDNPVGRGRYTPGKAFAGKRERSLLRRYRRLPWIPGDDEWRRACFRELKGLSASRLASLKPVAPIRRIEREDPRFIEAHEVLDELEAGSNLVTMDWQDFEMLVRDVFEKVFSDEGTELNVTRASRDDGVDAVVINPDPLKGGKTIVQAKRYRKAVPVAVVRELYGAMQNERAGKGILVTTAHYGRSAHEFAIAQSGDLLWNG